MKIGTQVHALTPTAPGEDHRCWVGWVTSWDVATDRGSVRGFRGDGHTALGMFLGLDVALLSPSETPEPELTPEGDYPAVLSIHVPGECPWER